MKLFVALLLFVTPVVADAKYIQPPLSDNFLPIVIEEPVKEEPKKPTDVVWLIKWYSKKYWVDESLALRIAGCESGYRNVKNKNSSAWWIYQQLGRYRPARAKKYNWEWYDRFDIEANIAVSIQMIKKEGTRHWNASKYCRWK